jgi:hypothetical protein
MSKPPPKDAWDKASALGTLFSTVMLGVLAVVFNKQSDDVKSALGAAQTSVSKATLVGSLITYLRTNDEGQDIALIALNRSIGDLDDKDESGRLMVVQIAHTVFNKRFGAVKANAHPAAMKSAQSAATSPATSPAPVAVTPVFDPATNVALRIMKDRCVTDSAAASGSKLSTWCNGDFAGDQQKVAQAGTGATGAARVAVVSSAQAKQNQTVAVTVKPSATNAVAAYLASAFSGVVYIQYDGTKLSQARADAERLREALIRATDANITVPPIENVRGSYENSVRYFHTEDAGLAERVAARANQTVKPQTAFSAVPFGPRSDVPRGQVEIWLNEGASPVQKHP